MQTTDVVALLEAAAKIAWPIVTVVLILIFRKDISDLLHRLQKGKVLGQEIELAQAASELRQNVEKLQGQPITQGALNNYLKRLVSDDGSCILKRMAKGVYKFCDPRMPSYIINCQC